MVQLSVASFRFVKPGLIKHVCLCEWGFSRASRPSCQDEKENYTIYIIYFRLCFTRGRFQIDLLQTRSVYALFMSFSSYGTSPLFLMLSSFIDGHVIAVTRSMFSLFSQVNLVKATIET